MTDEYPFSLLMDDDILPSLLKIQAKLKALREVVE